MPRLRDGVWWKQPILDKGPPGLRRALIGTRDRVQSATPSMLARVGRHGDLPDAVIIGAQKAGTTSMFDELRRHPQISTSLVKESHYFDENYARGERWYRALYPLAKPGQRIVEATPCYVSHPEVPARLHELLPDAKLVVMLRDPVSRAYSQYQHEVRLGFETGTFADAIASESSRIAGEAERMAADSTYVSKAWSHSTYVTRGRYQEQLERWYDTFPADQIKVVISEEYFGEPKAGISDVLDYLGLDPAEQPEPDGGYKSFSYGQLEGDVADELRATFAPLTAPLEAFLGRDLPATWPR